MAPAARPRPVQLPPATPSAAIREATLPHAAVRALRRSRARLVVLHALVAAGPATPTELARRTGLAPTAVYGALRGLGKRYRATESLVAMGLADRLRHSDGRGRYVAGPLAGVILRSWADRWPSAPPTLMGPPADSPSG